MNNIQNETLLKGKAEALAFFEDFYGKVDTQDLWFTVYEKGLSVVYELCLTDKINHFDGLYLSEGDDDNVYTHNSFSFYTLLQEGSSEMLNDLRHDINELKKRFQRTELEYEKFKDSDEILSSLALSKLEMIADKMVLERKLSKELYEIFQIAKLRMNLL